MATLHTGCHDRLLHRHIVSITYARKWFFFFTWTINNMKYSQSWSALRNLLVKLDFVLLLSIFCTLMVCFYNGGAPPLIVVLCATDSKILVLYLFH